MDSLRLTPGDVRTADDLAKLPPLSKDTVRANKDSLTATNFPRSRLLPGTTGGSTGEPLQYYHHAKRNAA